MRSTDVPTTLRDMWETRPARPHDDRMIAGVAAGIARRYDIDPVLVRVGFVVAALSGVGVALYIAGWIALPDTPADPTAPRGKRPHPVLMIGLVIAAAIGVGSFFDNGRGFLLPLLAVAVLLYLLHVSRGGRGSSRPPSATGSTAAPGADGPPASTPQGPSLVKKRDEPGTPAQDEVLPPSWDPLAAAPFAWDLPEPTPEPAPATPPTRRRAPVTAVTLGIALLAGAATAAITLLTGSATLDFIPVVLGVLLAVVGTGLVVGSFLHTGRGLVPIAILLGLLAWGALEVPRDTATHGFGDMQVRPATLAELAPEYKRAAGDVSVDLRSLPLTNPADSTAPPRQLSVETGAGDVDIWVPADTDVQFTGKAAIGDVRFPNGESSSGPGARLEVAEDLGADHARAGQEIQISARTGAGSVEVHRG